MTRLFEKYKIKIEKVEKTMFGFKRNHDGQLAILKLLGSEVKQDNRLDKIEKSFIKRLISKKKMKILQEMKDRRWK